MAAYRSRSRKRISRKRIMLTALLLILLTFLSAALQTTVLTLLPVTPALVLGLVCSTGFHLGEKAGGLLGVFAGLLTDTLGNVGFSFVPLVFMLCGYLCGILPGKFLVRNFPSFIVYILLCGAIRSGFTLIYFGIFSKQFDLWNTVIKLLLPEFVAFLPCPLVFYPLVQKLRADKS